MPIYYVKAKTMLIVKSIMPYEAKMWLTNMCSIIHNKRQFNIGEKRVEGPD